MGLEYETKECVESPPQYESSDNDSLRYTHEIGGNTSKATYQEASGAPVEVNSPLGYSVGWVTVVFLNLSKMIGTGVFSTRSYMSNYVLIMWGYTHMWYSIERPQGRWLCWPSIILLGDWILDGIQFFIRLYGICIVLPQSIGL
jgi:hypothetical protein